MSRSFQHRSSAPSLFSIVALTLLPAGFAAAAAEATAAPSRRLEPAATARVAAGDAAATPLDTFIAAPDESTYREVSQLTAGGLTVHVLELTSQTWRSAQEVDRPVWKHWLTIIRPDTVKYPTGLLIIGGGNNNRRPPDKPGGPVAMIAAATGSVVAELRMVPNQPLVFADDPEKRARSEDAIIAYTWTRYLATGDATWPGHLPMTKSAVRAMDAITACCAEHGAKVTNFVVSGASKRGWTTWLTAAADKRVVAIVPVVIDVLNIEPSMRHHFAAYGFWAPAIHDYVETRAVDKLGTPECRKLFSFIDPFSYRDRLSMPKYIVNSAGDQFFLPDSSQFYFKELAGEKYLRYVPNSDHSLNRTDAWQGLIAFYQAFLENKPRPRFSWTARDDGAIAVTAADKPDAVTLWQATNPKARDFRLDTIDRAWQSSPVKEETPGVYAAKVSAPAEGWTAFFIELKFPSGTIYPLVFTTDVRVVPDRLPFAGKESTEKP